MTITNNANVCCYCNMPYGKMFSVSRVNCFTGLMEWWSETESMWTDNDAIRWEGTETEAEALRAQLDTGLEVSLGYPERCPRVEDVTVVPMPSIVGDDGRLLPPA